MTIKEYIKKYTKAEDKELFFKNSIVVDYVPYRTKIIDCTGIVKATMEQDGIFKMNSPAQFMLFSIKLIQRYTDIEIEESVLESFEELDKENLINMIIAYIPEREINAYNALLKMCNDDYLETNRTITSFIETKFDALQLSLNSLLSAIESQIETEKI